MLNHFKVDPLSIPDQHWSGPLVLRNAGEPGAVSLQALCFPFHLTSTCWMSRLPATPFEFKEVSRRKGNFSVSQIENQNMDRDINLQRFLTAG